jgi:hypothetical protein
MLGVSLTMLSLQMHFHVSFKVSLWRFTLQQSHRYVAVLVFWISCVLLSFLGFGFVFIFAVL